MKKLLAIAIAGSLCGATTLFGRSAVLAQLGAAGVSTQGGTPAHAHHLVRLDADGRLAITTMPLGSSSFPLSKIVFLDPAHGVDVAHAGGPGAPYKTLSYAAFNYPSNAISGIVYVLNPGTYDSLTVDASTHAGRANLTLFGVDSAETFVPLVEFRGAVGANAVVDLVGVRVGVLRQANNRTLTVRMTSGARIDTLAMSHPRACVVYRDPSSIVGAFSGALAPTNILIHSAADIGYALSSPAHWFGAHPTTVSAALHALAARPYSDAGIGAGDMLTWNGTNWTAFARGTSNDFLIGGSPPSFVRRYIWPGVESGEIPYWDAASTNWRSVGRTTDTRHVLRGGVHPAFGRLWAEDIAQTNDNVTNTVQFALSDNRTRTARIETMTNFWTRTGTAWDTSAARGISTGDTNLWAGAANAWQQSAARGVTAEHTNRWTQFSRSWEESPAFEIGYEDIGRWNGLTNAITNIISVAVGQIRPSGATAGQVMKFDGVSWGPGEDDAGLATIDWGGISGELHAQHDLWAHLTNTWTLDGSRPMTNPQTVAYSDTNNHIRFLPLQHPDTPQDWRDAGTVSPVIQFTSTNTHVWLGMRNHSLYRVDHLGDVWRIFDQGCSPGLTAWSWHHPSEFQSVSPNLDEWSWYAPSEFQPYSWNLDAWGQRSPSDFHPHSPNLNLWAWYVPEEFQPYSWNLDAWGQRWPSEFQPHSTNLDEWSQRWPSEFQPHSWNLDHWAQQPGDSLLRADGSIDGRGVQRFAMADHSGDANISLLPFSASGAPEDLRNMGWLGAAPVIRFAGTDTGFLGVTEVMGWINSLGRINSYGVPYIIFDEGNSPNLSAWSQRSPSEFQPHSTNLVQWATVGTNQFQPFSTNLNQWATAGTNQFQRFSTNLNHWAQQPGDSLLRADGSVPGTGPQVFVSNEPGQDIAILPPGHVNLPPTWGNWGGTSPVIQFTWSNELGPTRIWLGMRHRSLYRIDCMGGAWRIFDEGLDAGLALWRHYVPWNFMPVSQNLAEWSYRWPWEFQPHSTNLDAWSYRWPSEFHPYSANLYQWAAAGTNQFQPFSANLVQWATAGTNQFQPFSANLVQWSAVATNQFQPSFAITNIVGVGGITAARAGHVMTVGWNHTPTNHIIPNANNAHDLGSTNMAFRGLFLGTNALHIGATRVMTYDVANTQLVFHVTQRGVEDRTHPVFHIQLGDSWTDFEIQASTNNFASVLYWFQSANALTNRANNDPGAWVYFTDDFHTDPRQWRMANPAMSIAQQRANIASSTVPFAVFYPSNGVPGWATWLSPENDRLTWVYARSNGVNLETNRAGTAVRWNAIVPVEWRRRRIQP